MRLVPFELPSEDGYPLRGKAYLPEGGVAPSVLIVHGFKGFMDWGFMPLLAERLSSAGLAACAFNFSGSGVGPDGESVTERARFEHNTYTRELAEIRVVMDRLTTGTLPDAPTRPGVVGLLGHSRGGGMGILAAAADRRVGCLVTWSAIATVQRYGEATLRRWREDGFLRVENARTGDVFQLRTDLLDDVERHSEELDILAAARHLDIPTLVVHGEEDESVPFIEAEQISAALGDGGEFLAIAETGHTYGARHPLQLVIPAALERAISASTAHLQRHLLGL